MADILQVKVAYKTSGKIEKRNVFTTFNFKISDTLSIVILVLLKTLKKTLNRLTLADKTTET